MLRPGLPATSCCGWIRCGEHGRQRNMSDRNGCARIVVTGGPGGGKTTAADFFRREMGDRVVLVPEAATILFGGGFPRPTAGEALKTAQKAIFHAQRDLEEVQSLLYPGRILLCDRGTVDGAAYWPDEPHHFFEAMGTSIEAEFARYDAVIFFESAAVGGMGVEGGNPVRRETIQEAARLDARLKRIWERHSRFVVVPHTPSFFKKISFGLAVLDGIVGEIGRKKPRG